MSRVAGVGGWGEAEADTEISMDWRVGADAATAGLRRAGASPKGRRAPAGRAAARGGGPRSPGAGGPLPPPLRLLHCLRGPGPRRPCLPDPAVGGARPSPPGPASSRTHQLGAFSAALAFGIPAAATAAPAPCSAAPRPAAAEAAAAAAVAPAAGAGRTLPRGLLSPPPPPPPPAAPRLSLGRGGGRGKRGGREPGEWRTSFLSLAPSLLAMAAAAPPSCGCRSRAPSLLRVRWRGDRCRGITASKRAPRGGNPARGGEKRERVRARGTHCHRSGRVQGTGAEAQCACASSPLHPPPATHTHKMPLLRWLQRQDRARDPRLSRGLEWDKSACAGRDCQPLRLLARGGGVVLERRARAPCAHQKQIKTLLAPALGESG